MNSFITTSGKTQSLVKLHRIGARQQLDENSVMIVEGEHNMRRGFIVGEASLSAGEASREFGTRFTNENWVRTIAARLVLELGAGSHKINLALVVNSDTIASFTGDEFENNATPETLERARELFSNIYFRTQDTRMLDIRQCHIEIEKLVFVTEIDAVTKSIPKEVSKAVLLQCGFGDTQLTCVTNGNNQGLSFRKAGMDAAIRTVANALQHENITKSAILNGWKEAVAHDSGLASNPLDFSEVKTSVIKDHFDAIMPELTQEYGDDFRHFSGVVVSGGGSNDKDVVNAVSNYFSNQQKEIVTISELCAAFPSPENQGIQNDTSAVYGALNFIQDSNDSTSQTLVAIDAGNGWSKSAMRKYN
ncbi:hypothetical protein [Photobacterium leiognathi]|uniref:hypothetical protein n=1 Tax=Photobacterium leiognathi TaxID=553611 RepID=UPI0029817B4E|nr:hypothetical protein [Photobacterium leiognathi]